MASSISGYRSPVDIGLGQVPQATDPDVFNEMTDVYNAIHLLNQYLDQLRVTAEGGGGSDQSPAESMPPNRYYVSVALQAIAIGQAVCPASDGQDGTVLGALAHDYTSTAPVSNFCNVALTAAAVGAAVQVGVGPYIISMPGTLAGQEIWAYSSRAINGVYVGDGGLYIGNPGSKLAAGATVYAMPVAICVANGFILFGQYLQR